MTTVTLTYGERSPSDKVWDKVRADQRCGRAQCITAALSHKPASSRNGCESGSAWYLGTLYGLVWRTMWLRHASQYVPSHQDGQFSPEWSPRTRGHRECVPAFSSRYAAAC
jgi:hypothetical protein